MEEAYPVLKRDYPLNEKNQDWWASDQDSHLTQRSNASTGIAATRLAVVHCCGAGKVIDWAIWTSRRMFARELQSTGPIRYADLAPWYDHVERFAGISGSLRANAATARRPVSAGDAAELWRGTRSAGRPGKTV